MRVLPEEHGKNEAGSRARLVSSERYGEGSGEEFEGVVEGPSEGSGDCGGGRNERRGRGTLGPQRV